MPPSVCFTPAVTPSEPLAACTPFGQESVLPVPSVQSLPASAARNCEKTLVVPEPSARTYGEIAVEGRLAPEFSALICGSSHFLILPWKMPARVFADRFRLSTPLTL